MIFVVYPPKFLPMMGDQRIMNIYWTGVFVTLTFFIFPLPIRALAKILAG